MHCRAKKYLTLLALVLAVFSPMTQAKEVVPLLGGVIIDGYDFGTDIGPKGSIAFDEKTGEFSGAYNALKLPPGREAIFAWVHDTVNQKTEYIGPVGMLVPGTAGKEKGRFKFTVPDKYKSGDFGTNEIIAFSAEKTASIGSDGAVAEQPAEPSGSEIQAALKPAFYLFAALPGADTELHYCGHGQDFFYAKAPEKQTCYD
jgi:hypothetical protein